MPGAAAAAAYLLDSRATYKRRTCSFPPLDMIYHQTHLAEEEKREEEEEERKVDDNDDDEEEKAEFPI